MAVSSGNRRKKQRRIIPNVQHSEAELTTKTTAVSRTEDTQGAEKTQDSSSSAAPANLELKDALVAQDGAHSEGGRGGEEGETCKASTGDAAASCSGNGDGRPKLSDKNDKIQNSEEPKANNDSSHKEHCANNDENAKGQKQQQHQEEEKGTIGTTTTSTIRSSGSSTTTNANDKTSYKNIKYAIVQNKSGGLNTSQTLQRLIALKSLFAKQLPKMPKEYIARLVFDRNHKSLALLNPDVVSKRTSSSNNGNDNGGGFVGDDEIIGGICYRSYADMKFAEIAFCAVSASQQVKGYGTKLMNLTKQHAVSEGIEYFITYADNYAIGYFKKQGFSKTISMTKSRYHGLIKDYDGGTMMECYIHPSIDYTRIPETIAAQREFILRRIREVAQSHRVIYPPLATGSTLMDGTGSSKTTRLSITSHHAPSSSSRGNEAVSRAMAIPGVFEAGWTVADLMGSTTIQKDVDRQRNHMKSEMLSIIRKTEEQAFSWPFREPVDTTEVKDYLEVITDPIDLSTIEKRIKRGDWYKSKQMLRADLVRMVNNCKTYNDSSSPYYECAVSLEKYLPTLFPDM